MMCYGNISQPSLQGLIVDKILDILMKVYETS